MVTYLLQQGSLWLAVLTTKEGQTARDLAVSQQKDALAAKMEWTRQNNTAVNKQRAELETAVRGSQELASQMIAVMDFEMRQLDTANLPEQQN